MDEVVDLIEQFANRGQPRGASRVLDDARAGTVALDRQPSTPASRRRGRLAVAVLAAVAVVGVAFVVSRNNPSQIGPAGLGGSTVLDNVSDADAARLCNTLKPLAAQATDARQSIDMKRAASTAKQMVDLASQARLMGATAFAAALTEEAEQLTVFAQQPLTEGQPGTTLSQQEFRVRFLRLDRARTELELACTARGHDPLFADQNNDTPTTTATR